MDFFDSISFTDFFFNTYPGYFLQLIPITLITVMIYYLVTLRKNKEIPSYRKIARVLFVCYIFGFLGLTLFIDRIGDMWYWILFQTGSGHVYYPLTWDCNFIPDFITRFNGEMLMNILVFLPFGILLPLATDCTWKKTVLVGAILIIAVELIQPFIGRAFDINDVILNILGLLISSTLFFLISKAIRVSGNKRIP
ncbi:MAG: VanZ family protein [Clostridia bacterium]|nr:VanZ family protein [Clostridia bacterium]